MFAAALSIAVSIALQADTIEFKEGLAIRGVMRSGRNPVFTDALLAHLARTGWSAAKAGDSVAIGSEKREWTKLVPQADGSFEGRAFSGGYASFEVESAGPRTMILEATGWGMVYADGAPRAGDPYGNGYLKLPVRLRAGKTGFLFASGRGNPRARLVSPPAPLFFNLTDLTVPDLVVGKSDSYWGAAIVVNATDSWQTAVRIRARLDDGPPAETAVPPIPPMTFRKVAFSFGAARAPETAGELPLSLALSSEAGLLDFQKIAVRVRGVRQTRKVTFFSQIDGSLQYYAVNPAQSDGDGKALVLTLHGAGVEAIGQADAYKGKDWCHIVAPTNRRPFGFDWEEIGRLDALEVLSHARASLKSDPAHTYLTGHSMGGHGAWTVGFHFPDLWAAVAPCAAWISFFSYGGGPRSEPKNAVDEMVFRAGNASDTLLMLGNSLNYPIYMHHGDKDETVSIAEARAMKSQLEKAGHRNFTLHEHPGGGHWFGESVDFAPIFDLFKTVQLTPSDRKDAVDFSTANLAATSKAWWVEILQQERPLAVSNVKLRRAAGRIIGTTANVEALRLSPEAFLGSGNPIVIELDGQTLSLANAVSPPMAHIFVKTRGVWTASGIEPGHKTPRQMGPFKNVFRNRFRFVYGTGGTEEEAQANWTKARFDAEVFGYRGNGSVLIQSDIEYQAFLEEQSKLVFIRKPDVDNVVLFGNADTNRAWGALLVGSPIRVSRGEVRLGETRVKGEDLACLFVRPNRSDDKALVGVVASTGIVGQRMLERMPYFTSGVHYPDWIVFSADMLLQGAAGIRAAGFFGNDWTLTQKDLAKNLPGGPS